MSLSHYRSLIGLIAFTLCASAQKSHAVLVDWSALTWAAGSLSNSYHVDPGTVGNDITIAVTGDTGQLQPSFTPPNPPTPAITQTFQGGFASIPSSLELRVDYTNTAQALTVTLTFAAHYTLGITNVSFTIFDIDSGTYQDQIRSITALSTDGVTQIAPTITGVGSFVTLNGSGLGQTLTGNATSADTGAGSGNGNATISFGPANIRSITFTYGSGPSAPADPTTQKIGLYNIDFSVVPEINPTIASSLVCLLAIGFHYLRRRRDKMGLEGDLSLRKYEGNQ